MGDMLKFNVLTPSSAIKRTRHLWRTFLAFADLAGGSASLPAAPAADAGGPAPYMWLGHPVPHTVLLPLMDLAVHHGGMGTTHSTVAAGEELDLVKCLDYDESSITKGAATCQDGCWVESNRPWGRTKYRHGTSLVVKLLG